MASDSAVSADYELNQLLGRVGLRKRIVVLGSTGSIGTQTLDVVRALPDHLEVVGLAAGKNWQLLHRQVAEFRPQAVSAASISSSDEEELRRHGVGCQTITIEELAALPEADIVVVATVAGAGLRPTLAAIRAHKTVALANKEVLVIAGEIVTKAAREGGVGILPIDSEHSAIWQSLLGELGAGPMVIPPALESLRNGPVRRLILTASGGAFRDYPADRLWDVSPAQALQHPTWYMGAKITIDSATLINKGFEVMEAQWLFGTPYDNIDVVLHRESIVHSMVEFVDGSIKAQLGPTDMRLPIQFALLYPKRLVSPLPGLELTAVGRLTFEELELSRYPCFTLALQAARAGGTYPAVLSGADEAAVELFLRGAIPFPHIAQLVETALAEHKSSVSSAQLTVEDLLDAEDWAKKRCLEVVARQ